MKFEQNNIHVSHQTKTPDYAYANGLHIKQSHYGGHDYAQSTETALTYDQLRPDTRLLEQLPVPERIVRSFGATAIEGQLIRSSTDAGTLNLVYMGWGGNNDNPIAQKEQQLHAAHNPHADVLQISNPGHGQSSRLPGSLSRMMANTGHFGPQGELHAEVIDSVLADYDHVNIAGHSYGARQAIALAAALDRPVDNLHLLDAPGSRDLGGLPGIAKAFMSLEGAHAGQYQQSTPDKDAAEIQRLGDSTPLQDIYRLARNGGLPQQFFDQTRAMAKAGLEHDLALACPNVRNTIKFTSPELSELNYLDDVSAILTRLATATRPIEHNVVLDHSHSFIAANPAALTYVQRFSASPSKPI